MFQWCSLLCIEHLLEGYWYGGFTVLNFPWKLVENSKFHEVTSGPWEG